ncbi:tRNA methyltransferase, partial [Candidatus Pacearchaeota archaeon]
SSNKELENFLRDILSQETYNFFVKAKKEKLVIRVNTLKITKENLKLRLEKQGFILKDVPFLDYAFWVEKSPIDIGKTLEHFLGYYYVQEITSMLPVEVLDPQPEEIILDLTAAPGSKTTQIAQKMQNSGVIIANDIDYTRLKALTNNIDRLGILNVIVTNMDGGKFGEIFPEKFDKVLIDAPCSALGTLPKAPELKKWWNWSKIGKLVSTQRKLIISGFKSLKKNGIMVYSTCTFTPQENEEIVNFLLNNFPQNAKIIDFKLPKQIRTQNGLTSWKNKKFNEDLKKTKRIIPTPEIPEGFYIAKIQKI